MRKILLFILLFCLSKISFSQNSYKIVTLGRYYYQDAGIGWHPPVGTTYPVTQFLGSTNTMVTSRGGLSATETFVLPAYVDTAAANANGHTNGYVASIIWSTSDSSIYVYQKSSFGNFWFKAAGSGGGATGNFFNLTGNYVPVTPANLGVGFNDPFNSLYFRTNNLARLGISVNGILNSTASDDSVLVKKLDGTMGVIAKSALVGSTGWLVTGNSGLTAGTNFLGTTDAVDLVLKRNSSEAMRIYSSNNYIGIGSATPTAKLNVVGTLLFTNSSSGFTTNYRQNEDGLIRLVTKQDGVPADSAFLHLSDDYEVGMFSMGQTAAISSRMFVNQNVAAIEVTNYNGGTVYSGVNATKDSLALYGTNGIIKLYPLSNLSTQDRLIGIRNSTGQIGNITLGTGISLSSGVLSATGTGGTVTSIATTSPITGGTITSTGTIGCATCVTSAASLTSGNLMTGAGSQGSQTITTGTGVTTALGVNVGSAGAFVTFNGALGTPSSGTVTNLTGTASININGTVGATTPAAGTFTTAIANSFVPNSSTVPSNGLYLPASNTLGWAINSAAETQLTSTALSPAADGGNSLGTTALGWQNLFANTGFVLNIENSDWVATHTTGILTVGTGDLRVTNAGTNSASVVTVGGTQTLTAKTLTSPVINVTSDATGDIYYRNSGGLFTRLPIGGVRQKLGVVGGIPTWVDSTASTGGTVTSVSGTTNRITSTGGTTPVIDISASYVGQSSITTLGTIGTGVWNAGNVTLPASGSLLTVGGGATAGKLRFMEPSGSGSNYSEFQAVAQAGNITYSLPPSLLAGGVLTDVAGNGVLTWAAGGGTSIPSFEVAFGNGTGITSNSDFSYQRDDHFDVTLDDGLGATSTFRHGLTTSYFDNTAHNIAVAVNNPSPPSTFSVWGPGNIQGLKIDIPNNYYGIGDIDGQNQATRILIDDATRTISINAGVLTEISGPVILDDLAGTGTRAVLAASDGTLSAPISDERFKWMITPANQSFDAIGLLRDPYIHGIYWNWKDTKRFGTGREIGFTAQMFEKIPGMTGTMIASGEKYLNYDRITVLLWEQNREQQKQIDELKLLVEKLLNK